VCTAAYDSEVPLAREFTFDQLTNDIGDFDLALCTDGAEAMVQIRRHLDGETLHRLGDAVLGGQIIQCLAHQCLGGDALLIRNLAKLPPNLRLKVRDLAFRGPVLRFRFGHLFAGRRNAHKLISPVLAATSSVAEQASAKDAMQVVDAI